jgi:2-haloacid dehalogenase
MRFDDFKSLSFDCYGTLIDWETGIVGALGPLLAGHGVELSDQELLELFAEVEPAQQAGEYRLYREILESVVDALGERFGFTPSPSERVSLPESVADWQPFPDTVESLQALGRRFELVIISNIDDDLFALSAGHLSVPFDHVVTAEQARSYKPSHANFRLAFERMGRGPAGVLHVAQSLYHDIAPANELGLRSVWVNRRAGREGSGATVPSAARPDLEVRDLATLVQLMA